MCPRTEKTSAVEKHRKHKPVVNREKFGYDNLFHWTLTQVLFSEVKNFINNVLILNADVLVLNTKNHIQLV